MMRLEPWIEAKGCAQPSLRLLWAALILCLLNLAFFSLIKSDVTTGDQLLENADFARGLAGWEVQGARQIVATGGGAAMIDHGAVQETTMLSQCRAAETFPNRMMLSAEARSRAVVRGAKHWHDARIELVGYNTQGKANYRVKSLLVGMDGDRAWRSFGGIFLKPASTSRICIKISLYAAPGSFAVRHLSLYEVTESPVHVYGSGFLLVGWVVLGLCLAISLFNHYKVRSQGLYLLLLVPLLLGGILMPQELRSSIEGHLLPVLSRIGLHLESTKIFSIHDLWALWPERWDISKLSHFVGFTLLTLIVFSDRDARARSALSALLLLAVATELMQFFVPERTPRLSDVIVDSSGVCLAYVLSLSFIVLSRRRQAV